jgi:CRP-like cAMP-binding protein
MTNSLLFGCIDCPTRPSGPLSEIPEELLKDLSKARVTNIYKKGQIIYYEGNKPYGVYCINSGKIKLQKYAENGKSYISSISKPGDMLGYKAFFTDDKFSETAEALEDSMICFLDREKFFSLIKKEPKFSLKLLSIMANEVKCAENHARDMAYKSTQERIVEVLLTLKEAFGVEQKDGSFKIDINLSRDELASLIGTTTETTVRLLSWLKEKNILETNKKTIYIKNNKALVEMLPSF